MKKRVILLIDDSFDLLHQLVDFLLESMPDHVILTAPNGESGWRMIQEKQPHLVFTDWEMPKLNGIQLVKKIKAIPHLKQIPVILMTGKMISSDDLKIALEAGATDYLRKPFDFVELEARMHAALEVYDAKQEIIRQHETIQQYMLQEQERLRNEVDLKNRKLSTNMMLTVDKSELLQRIQTILEGTIPLLGAHPSEQRQLKLLTQEIKGQSQADNNWDQVKLHFEEVHPNFFKELSQLSATLTSQDLKLAAYVKLGLSTKEIAVILNITAGSTRKSIYRLKKRLNLPEEEEMRKFIQQLG